MDKQQSTCACGCGEAVLPGSRFRHGHWARTRPKSSRADRFWPKVDRQGADDCWEWKASRNPQGYGWFWDAERKRMVGAHRVAFELANGALPAMPSGRCGASGVLVLHRCDNPPCCNPAHLFAGEQEDNMADMRKKGRAPDNTGTKNPNAKLTAAQVEEIRSRYTGAYGEQSQLAREFGVWPSTIRVIVLGKKWQSS